MADLSNPVFDALPLVTPDPAHANEDIAQDVRVAASLVHQDMSSVDDSQAVPAEFAQEILDEPSNSVQVDPSRMILGPADASEEMHAEGSREPFLKRSRHNLPCGACAEIRSNPSRVIDICPLCGETEKKII